MGKGFQGEKTSYVEWWLIHLRTRHPYSLACLTCFSNLCLQFWTEKVPKKKASVRYPHVRILVWIDMTKWLHVLIQMLKRFDKLTRSLLWGYIYLDTLLTGTREGADKVHLFSQFYVLQRKEFLKLEISGV